ncbi:MAG TPA: tetratricopeptide repeat protein [Conexibacter sp.]|nr:tetratricopeptide repeat protein [Conexibacter sp.]
MSSVIAAPSSSEDAAASERAGIVSRTRPRLATHSDALVVLLLAALLVAVSFGARSGSMLSRATTVEMALTLLGAAAVAVAILMRPPRQRLWGGVTLLLFAALAVWTALSIAWSVQPSDSWEAANLTFAYLAVFAGGLALAHVIPARWTGVLGGVVLASVVLCGYSLLVKVFPSISSLDLYARLRAPFDYWNAVGLMAALGIPGCLWLGARRDGHAALSALAVPALGLLLVALLLSYGRGPLLATAVAVACWFAIVPLRLRGLAVLATAGAGTAIVCAWAFANDGLAKDGTPLDVRADAGHSLGLLLIVLLIVLLLAGLALSFAMARSALSPQGRRALGTGVLIALALVPLAGIGALAASDRGLGGSISHGWHQLTDPNAQQPANDPGRLASVGGVRARYWDNGFEIWRKAPWLGVGADGYATARKPIQPDRLRVRHAHGYVPQTLADLGLIGMGINVALLLAWLGAAARATGVRPRRRWGAWLMALARTRDTRTRPEVRARQPMTPERIGLMTLATTAIAFGVHSAVDWTWFVPGTAITGLLCAAWVAGRGPLGAAPAPPAALPRGQAGWSAARGRIALAALVLAVGLAGAWTIWQPQRSIDASDAALTALLAGHPQDALADAQNAVDINPLSIDPLLTLAAVQRANRQPDAARATLQRVVRLQPANPETWLRLGQFELNAGHARRALRLLGAAIYLDPRGPEAQTAYAQAQQAVAQKQAARAR